ncbi:malectin domain-containing carbohydrate-binding protein [Gloeobacter morelensis]|uniref:malectin domain-containing carbohydrate-binding protein n=1 Tax=Gloeobacter morelensis TaxID=2907343 RepID=UPI001E527743|nr:malectin domain-containing carbohydrate-binding protein [Gloeobacter morelensis]UFP97242.1 hypothetical protein ISF26_24275 [Gloeobacter morelensis MG652769]
MIPISWAWIRQARLTLVGPLQYSFFAALLFALAPVTPGHAQSVLFRADSGSTVTYSGTNGDWAADAQFSGGNAEDFGNLSIANTDNDPLYDTERWGAFSYNVPVGDGSVRLKLYFSENYHNGAGQRKFAVRAEGKTLLEEFDVYAAAGGKYKAIGREFDVQVTDGTLNVEFVVGSKSNPFVNALEVASNSSSSAVSVSLKGLPGAISAGVPINVEAVVTTASASAAKVVFKLDGKEVKTENQPAYCLGGGNGPCLDYSTKGLSSGSHTLVATATVDGKTYSSPTASFTIASSSGSTAKYPISFSDKYVGPKRGTSASVDAVLDAIGAPGRPGNDGATWSTEVWSTSQAGDEFSREIIGFYLANGIEPTISSSKTVKVQTYSGVTYGPSLSPRDGIDKDAADNKPLPDEEDWPHLRVPTDYFKDGNPMPEPFLPYVGEGQGGYWYHVGDESQPLREVWDSPLCYGDDNVKFSTVNDADSSVSGTQPILQIKFTIPPDYQPVFRNDGDNPAIIAGRQADGRGAMTEIYHASEGTGSYAGDLGSCYDNGTNTYPYPLEGASNAASKEKYAAKLITPSDASRVAKGEIKHFDHPIGFASYKHLQAVVPPSQSRDKGMDFKKGGDWGWLMYGSRVRLMLSDSDIDALTSNLMVRAMLKTYNRHAGVKMDGSGFVGHQVQMRASLTEADLAPFGGAAGVNEELDRVFKDSRVKENWALVIPPMWPTRLDDPASDSVALPDKVTDLQEFKARKLKRAS